MVVIFIKTKLFLKDSVLVPLFIRVYTWYQRFFSGVLWDASANTSHPKTAHERL